MADKITETSFNPGDKVRHKKTGQTGQVIAMRPWSPAFVEVRFDDEKGVRPVWHSDLRVAPNG